MNVVATKQIVISILLVISFYSCQKLTDTIYLLEWTNTYFPPFSYLGGGYEPFVSRNCSFQNCFIVNHSYFNHSYFNNVLQFDAILFNVCNLQQKVELPKNRTENQLYILVALESSAYCPLTADYNDFFNLTWTYKLNSDVAYPYLTVKNKDGELLGPKREMHWLNLDEMAPTDNNIVSKLQKKSIAAAWIASNCRSIGRRIDFVKSLQSELSKYGQRIDVFGSCGTYMDCEKFPEDMRADDITKCCLRIKTDYYFYLAFENSCCEDYVTEKVLHGLKYFAVPVVYGGANYTRFMPDGIYLNALNLGVEKLAKEMNDIIQNPQRYYDYFKWHGYYSISHAADDDYREAVCGLCALLNNKTRRNERTSYKNMTDWWNSSGLP